ncbi:hypothetical protein AB0H58_07600 [Nocardia neocaledoniensis]|uniref:hypothetical protein n=1 Tax=Nocardia neocaledoniensis TaxID=236511 RepID=UPI0033F73AD2
MRAPGVAGDTGSFETLHAYFLDHLLPVCAELLDAAVAAGEIDSGLGPYQLLRGIGNLCIGAESDTRYDPRPLVALLIAGLARPS